MAEHSRQESSAFNLGQGASIGSVQVGGSVVGGNQAVGPTPADAATAAERQELLARLEQLPQQVAALQGAPAHLHEDAQDELRKARQAGEDGDAERLVEKLQTAEGYLTRIGQTLPV